jgi:hypothetical protein
MPKGNHHQQSILVTQTRTVGEIKIGPGGDQDPIEIFAQMAARDAADDFRSDRESSSVYEIDTAGTLDMGRVAITIEHDPHGEKPPTVAEAQAMLKKAREFERQMNEPVAETTDQWS